MNQGKQSITSVKLNIKFKSQFDTKPDTSFNSFNNDKKVLYDQIKSYQNKTRLTENESQQIEMLRNQVGKYSKNYVETIQSKSIENNFNALKFILDSANEKSFKDMSYQEYSLLYRTQPHLLKEIFAKYKDELLDTLDYSTITDHEKQLISKYITKNKPIIMNTNSNKSYSYSNNNNMKQSDLIIDDREELFDTKNNIKINNSNTYNTKNDIYNINSVNDPKNETNRRNFLLCNEFKAYVRNEELNQGQIMYYFGESQDVKAAAELYFQSLHNSKELYLIYVFPNQKRTTYTFNFNDSPDELIMQVYRDHPDMNDPVLYLDTMIEFSFDPSIHRCVGALFKNNSILYVKSG